MAKAWIYLLTLCLVTFGRQQKQQTDSVHYFTPSSTVCEQKIDAYILVPCCHNYKEHAPTQRYSVGDIDSAAQAV